MKTMNEIVESIKNDELRAFATKLQQKLEQARDVIVTRRKKVSGAEKSALRNSVSEFVEKQRGMLPQKVAGLLAVTMLTVCLASCDEFDRPEHQEHTGKSESITSEIIGNDNEINIEYDKIFGSQMGFVGVLRELDFVSLYYSEEGSEFINRLHSMFLEEVEKYPGEPVVSYMGYNAYYNLTNARSKVQNIVWEIGSKNSNSGWKHTLVSTADDFALLSKKGSKYYITGFVNGKIYDGTRTIGSKDLKFLQNEIAKNGYDATMNKVRNEFWGLMARADSPEAVGYKLRALKNCDDMKNEDGETFKHPSDYIYWFSDINVVSLKTDKVVAKIVSNYDIQNDYLDQYLPHANKDGSLIDEFEDPSLYESVYEDEEYNDEDLTDIYIDSSISSEIETLPPLQEETTEPPVVRPEDDLPDWWGEEVTTAKSEVEPVEPETVVPEPIEP